MHFLPGCFRIGPARPQLRPAQAPLATTGMDTSRWQGSSGYVDASRRHVPFKSQAAASVTDFVLRRAKAFRGERGPQTPPYQAALRPPRGATAQEEVLRRRRTAPPHEGAMTGGEERASTTNADLPPPSVQLRMGTLHSGAAGMASFISSGGRERPVSLAGSPAGWAKGGDTTATLEPCRFGLNGSSAAASPVDEREELVAHARCDSQSNPAKEGRGGMPLAKSLAATLFPPAAPSDTVDGVAVGGQAAGRVGHRTNIFGHP